MQNTHSPHNLGVSSPPTNLPQKKLSLTPNNTQRTYQGGRRQWPISYSSSSLPTPTPLLSCYIGSLPGCKSWWHNYAQETSKNGLKQEIAMKLAIGLHTKQIIKGHWGAKSKYIPSDLFYFLSTIFHFQPPALSHNCTHFSGGLGNFYLNVLLNIPCLKIVGSIWAYQCEFNRERRPQKSLTHTTHMHTQKEIRKC